MKQCNAKHPTLPVTCRRLNDTPDGRCPTDSHAGVHGEPPHAQWVQWGKDYTPLGPANLPAGVTGYAGWQPHGTAPER